MKYKKPILNEIYIEFTLEKEISSDMQYRISSIMDKYYGTVELEPNLNTNIPNTRIKLWNKDKTELFQIFNNRIVINNITLNSSYKGWNDFLKSTLDLKRIIDENIKDNLTFNNLSLCYLNKISNIPKEDFKLGHYINCDGNMIPKSFYEINQVTDIVFGIGNVKLDDKNNQLKIRAIMKNDKFDIQLEIICQRKLTDVKITAELEEMHNYCFNLFENIITDKVKNEIMEGDINGSISD